MALPFSRPVALIRNPGTPAEEKLLVEGTIQSDRAFFPANTPIYEGDTIEIADSRGGIRRLTVTHVKVNAVGSALDHLEIRWSQPSSNTRPSHEAIRSQTVIQNFNGPVGAVQTGDGSTAHVVQSRAADVAEITHLIDSLLRSSGDLSPGAQQDLREQVEELRAELAASNPKPSRVKAFLGAMWHACREVATVAPKLIELAQKLGYPVVPK